MDSLYLEQMRCLLAFPLSVWSGLGAFVLLAEKVDVERLALAWSPRFHLFNLFQWRFAGLSCGQILW